jgi:hypothetical protein
VFDMPLPAGVSLEGQQDNVLHFRIDAPLEALLAFYQQHGPPGTRIDRMDHGVRIRGPADGPAVYLYRERGHGPWLVSYFDAEGSARGAAALSGILAAPSGNGTPSQTGGGPGRPASSASDSSPPGNGGGGLPSTPQDFDRRLGNQVAGGSGEQWQPAPGGSLQVPGARVHPRLEAMGLGRPRSNRPPQPLSFGRGLREPRRNPDALF